MNKPSVLMETPHLASWCDWTGIDPLPIASGERSCVLWLRSGSGLASSVHNRIPIAEGECLFVPPQVEATLRPVADLPIRAVAYYLTGIQVQGKPRGRLSNAEVPFLVPLPPDRHKTGRILEDILHEARQPQLGSSDVISSLLRALLIHFLREMRDDEPTAPVEDPEEAAPAAEASAGAGTDAQIGLAHHVRVYIESNFQLELSLSDLAQIVYVSPYHLAHVFKEEVGMSPIQYLIKCRIDEAKRLLLATDFSVREIATRVGYPNANYFNLLFSKLTGDSPGKYRKRR